jgi:hypothetical protein
MADYVYDFFVGETLPVLPFAIERAGVAVNLTDADVTLLCPGLGLEVDMTVTDIAGGEVEYHFEATDLSRAGNHQAWIKLEEDSGDIQYFPGTSDRMFLLILEAPTEPVVPAP